MQISDAELADFFEKVESSESEVRSAIALSWEYRSLDDSDCNAIAYLIAVGALQNLKELGLAGNQIGDVGLTAFSAALGSGALANLEELDLDGNQIGDLGVSALASACANGAMANLEELELTFNQIGDPGMTSLSDALAVGALPQLEFLEIGFNRIGDDGLISLLKALPEGARRWGRLNLQVMGLNWSENPQITSVGLNALYRVCANNDPGVYSLWSLCYQFE